MTGQHFFGQRHQQPIRPDNFTGTVHHAQAVGVAVESQTDIGALFHNRRLQIGQIFGDTGIRMMVGKAAVHFTKQFYDFATQRPQQKRRSFSGNRVATIHHHF